ncbi:MAG: tRNA 2-thiouridine(34) synthase MnmA [Phycisphaerales bacterium JB065]
MARSKGKVLVAMSGGVDSSVAAALLLREGYEVVGCFMRLGSPGETLDQLEPFDSAGVSCDPTRIKIGHQGCCSINDAADARSVAAELGVPFYVCNFKKDFNRIIDYFVEEYANGRTPNPCVRCNDWLKFGKLHAYAKQIDAQFVASGHYARVDRSTGSPRLLRGVDYSKDQSYVLFGAPRPRLQEMLLPIGGYEKPEVRAIAEELGLPVFDKPDSQEICFVPDNDYAGLVERRREDLAGRTGDILDTEGKVVGQHEGQHRFTIGQRRGVGVALGYPIYVVDKDPETNTITVGDPEKLMSVGCTVAEANWLIDEPPLGEWQACLAQVRYNSEPVPARVRVIDPMELPERVPVPSGRTGAFELVFDKPQRAVTPGQAAALYSAAEPDLVLGGGWIAKLQQ